MHWEMLKVWQSEGKKICIMALKKMIGYEKLGTDYNVGKVVQARGICEE